MGQGKGRLEMEQTGTDFLDDTAKITTAKDKDEPEVKRGRWSSRGVVAQTTRTRWACISTAAPW